jgi:hypothetical protein
MHKNIPVIELKMRESYAEILEIGEWFSTEHLPIGVKIYEPCGIVSERRIDIRALNEWLKSRTIPTHRQNFKELEYYKLGRCFNKKIVMKSYGLSFSDHYWLNPINNPLKWEGINFFDNPYSEDVGDIITENPKWSELKPFDNTLDRKDIDFVSPDNTTDGWLIKRWKTIDGKHYLIKNGHKPFVQEPSNEAVASLIAKRLGIPHVPYTVIVKNGIPYSVCENLVTAETELVTAYQIYKTESLNQKDDSYEHFMKRCQALGIPDVQINIDKMIVFDMIISNKDRHYLNFGAIKNADTLQWQGIAPMFDNGSSFWYRILTEHINVDESIPYRPFGSRGWGSILGYVKDYSWLDLSALNGVESEMRELFALSPFVDEERIDKICAAFLERVKLLEKCAKNN